MNRRSFLSAILAAPAGLLVGCPQNLSAKEPTYHHVLVSTPWHRLPIGDVEDFHAQIRIIDRSAEDDLQARLAKVMPTKFTKLFWRRKPWVSWERDFETQDYIAHGGARFSWMYDQDLGDLREEIEPSIKTYTVHGFNEHREPVTEKIKCPL